MLDSTDRIVALLDQLRDQFPHQKTLIEAEYKTLGIEESAELIIEKPKPLSEMPTFDPSRTRQISPLLKARFEYCGRISYADEIWLGVDEIHGYISNDELIETHESLRHNWQDSAPNLFQDDQLSLFAVFEQVPDHLTYLVWSNDKKEPELWKYSGVNFQRYADLSSFLERYVNQQ